ncbi:MAG: hypothetical protein IT374_15240 [Polyangiaceae bacterium]|nr:hypothetical protein [Polyangiaceae bacterium]
MTAPLGDTSAYGSGPAPLSATRAYRFAVQTQADGARALVIPVTYRGTWDDFGVEERREQGTFVWRTLDQARIGGRGRYPGEWLFDDEGALTAAWAAITARLRPPASAPPEARARRAVPAAESAEIAASLVARGLDVMAALSPHDAVRFEVGGASQDVPGPPRVSWRFHRCEDALLTVQATSADDGVSRTSLVGSGIAHGDGVRATLLAILGPSGGELSAEIAGVFDADEIARLFTR